MNEKKDSEEKGNIERHSKMNEENKLKEKKTAT